MGLSAPLADSKTKNCSKTPNFHQNLEVVALKSFNQLMTTSVMTQPAPVSWLSKNLQGKKIHMSGLDTAQRKFTIRPKEKFQDQ